MINFKKAVAAAVCCVFCTALATGCGEESKSSSESKSGIVNFTAPEKGEEVLVLTVKDYGDIKIKLFPDEAEKGVENIKGLAEDNYYDGLIFHRIISDFMIQGGDPLGNGTGGESIWGEKFDGGTSDNLIHAAGAVAYANSGSTATNGSQFYIVTGTKLSDDDVSYYEQNGITIPAEAQEIYKNDGGTPWLDGGYTVFGQVYDGLDIVFELQNVETDANDKPVEDVVIEKISVEEYDGGDVKFHLSDY
ncbi:MAG: peptidylprolyl isomerase [Porcipelethomonas sp.]